MSVPDAPRVRIKGNGIVRLLAWERDDDGWWALYLHTELATAPVSYAESVELTERRVPAADVVPLDGEDYSAVPRRRSGT